MKTRHPESAMQQWFIDACWRHPVARRIYAIPNGGKRSKIEAAIMKAEGVKAGMPDTHLPVARGGCIGLYIELKCGSNSPSDEQEKRIVELAEEGHAVAVIWDDWHLCWDHVQRYLAGEIKPGTIDRIKPPKAPRAARNPLR